MRHETTAMRLFLVSFIIVPLLLVGVSMCVQNTATVMITKPR